MRCATVKIGNTVAIVCGRPRKPKKCQCDPARPATRLCDWKMGGGKTCDVALCDICAFAPAHKKDLCPAHKETYKAWRASKDAKEKKA